MSPESRIGKRSREQQKARDELVSLLKKKRQKEQKWKQISTRLERKQAKFESKKLDMEVKDMIGLLDSDQITSYDLKFLESLSYSDLSKIPRYSDHWMRRISHSYRDERNWEESRKYPIFPKYVFLYEISKDKPLIPEEKKLELREKAKMEVRQLVVDEIKWDTFLYERDRSTLEHIFEYIPQKTVANKLRWTWNMWTDTCVDVLLRYIDWFPELDEDYKKEIKREYDKKRGIIDPTDEEEGMEEEIETQKDYEDDWEVKWWDELVDAFIESKKEDVKAFLSFIKQKEKDKRRFDDWLESEWGL